MTKEAERAQEVEKTSTHVAKKSKNKKNMTREVNLLNQWILREFLGVQATGVVRLVNGDNGLIVRSSRKDVLDGLPAYIGKYKVVSERVEAE